jgi:hypothetical protein
MRGERKVEKQINSELKLITYSNYCLLLVIYRGIIHILPHQKVQFLIDNTHMQLSYRHSHITFTLILEQAEYYFRIISLLNSGSLDSR